MASLNKVTLIGYLGADPEARYLPGEEAVAVTTIRLATTDRLKDKSTGEMKEFTEWHRVVFFGRLAEIAGKYLKKGSLVYIEGRIHTRKRQDQNSPDRYNYTIEIIANQMQMLSSRSGVSSGSDTMDSSYAREPERTGARRPSTAGQADDHHSNHPNAPSSSAEVKELDDDIPF